MVAENIPCSEKVPFFCNGSCDGPMHPIAAEFGELPVGFKNIFGTPHLFSLADGAAGVNAAAPAVPNMGVPKQ